ncbi:MAG: FGGY-family carbohydrate kinase [Candidatus Bathyarchaeota archaeon]
MSCDSFLVIDAGSGSVKSFLISPQGEILKRSERYWDRDSWRWHEAWVLIMESVHELMKESNVNLLGVSSTSMREEFILLDESGDEIGYQLGDESEKYGYKVLDECGERMYRSSGHWPVPNWMAGAILPWLSGSQPRLFERVSSVLMISDWVNFKLSGEAATEGSSACETSLFNIVDYDWDWRIIESLGLPASIFPKALKNSMVIGCISSDISRLSDIPEGTPVVIGGADTQCGLLGMGTFKGEAAAVGGTTTPVQVVVDEPVFDPEHRTWSNNYLFDEQWILESNVGYTGRGIRWLRDEFLKEDSGYYELNKGADKVPVGSNGLLAYLGPHLFDSGPPYWPMDKLGNLPVEPTVMGNPRFDVSELARAIFEANSYAVKANLVQLQGISGLEFDQLRFCGGNSRSDLWMQIQADVLGVPVVVPLVHDATAIGTAILASLGTGFFGDVDEAVECMVKLGRVYEPRKNISEQYDAHYRRWMSTREKLGRQ